MMRDSMIYIGRPIGDIIKALCYQRQNEGLSVNLN